METLKLDRSLPNLHTFAFCSHFPFLPLNPEAFTVRPGWVQKRREKIMTRAKKEGKSKGKKIDTQLKIVIVCEYFGIFGKFFSAVVAAVVLACRCAATLLCIAR